MQAGAGQTEIASDLAGAAIQKTRRPDIGEEADAGLRHREKCALGGDAVAAVDRYAGAAAHRDPVDDREIRFGEAMNPPDQLVFFTKKDRGQVRVAADPAPRLIDRAHIAAGAECPVAGAADDHGIYRRVGGPVAQCRVDASVIVEGQRIERLRPVDRQDRQAAFPAKQDLVGIGHQLPSRHRAMMTRMISLVPSRI